MGVRMIRWVLLFIAVFIAIVAVIDMLGDWSDCDLRGGHFVRAPFGYTCIQGAK